MPTIKYLGRKWQIEYPDGRSAKELSLNDVLGLLRAEGLSIHDARSAIGSAKLSWYCAK